MEKSRLDDIMFESVAKTIENMAFTEILPTNIEMIAIANERIVALDVLNPCPGRFTMLISYKLLSFIAEALFAKPIEEIKEANLLDFQLELLNTVAGSFLNSALPDDTRFNLGLATEISQEEYRVTCTEQTIIWNFTAEETVFSISLSNELVGYMEM